MAEQTNQTSEYTAISRQLERLEDRTRDLATRQDLEALRKDMVTRDLLEAQFQLFRTQMARMEQDRTEYRKEVDERFAKVDEQFETLKTEQTSRSERLWQRISPVLAAIALLLALLQFLSHVRLTP